MKRLVLAALAVAIVASAGGAFAHQDGYGRDSSKSSRQDSQYGPGTQRNDVAQVIKVQPIRHRYSGYQYQECWNNQSNSYDGGYYRDRSGRLYRDNYRDGTARVLNGQSAEAEAVGVVVGMAISQGAGRGDGYDRYTDDSNVSRRCRNASDNNRSRRIGMYNVTYRYAGQTYQTATNYDPGRTMQVMVDIRARENKIVGRD